MSQEWQPPDLGGRVAVVAGATRGVGRGIAEALGACGAFVYVTGRSTRALPTVDPQRTVEAVVENIVGNEGSAEAVVCDHKIDQDVERVFERVRKQHGGFDILVSNQIGWGDTPSEDDSGRRDRDDFNPRAVVRNRPGKRAAKSWKRSYRAALWCAGPTSTSFARYAGAGPPGVAVVRGRERKLHAP